MKNFYNKNTKNVKYVDTQNIVKYPVNKVNLVEKETLNKFRSNIAQDLINNIDYLKAKFVDLKSVSLNNNYIKNYLYKDKITNLEENLLLKINRDSNFNNFILTFESLLKDLNLFKTELNDLNKSNIYKQELNKDKLSEFKSIFNLASEPKMEGNGLFMSLSSTNDFYFYLVNALNYIYTNKNNKLIVSGQSINSNEEIKTNVNLKLRHYINLLTKYNFNLSTSYYNFFQFNKNNKYLFKMEKASELLKLAFLAKGCLISKPIFNIVYPQGNLINEEHKNEFNNNKVNNKNLNKPKIIIHLFYYIKTKNLLDNNYITSVYNDKLANLCDYISKLFGTEIELDLVRLYQPYQDSNILVQYLNSKSYNVKFILTVSKLFKRIKIYKRTNSFNLLSLQEIKNQNNIGPVLFNESVSYPSGISGINIRLAGRPMKERIVPRYTVKRAQRGNFNKLNTKMIERSMFTDKTKKGSFNFTVRLSHIFK